LLIWYTAVRSVLTFVFAIFSRFRTLLYEIFLGRHPYKGIQPQTLIWKVSKGHVASVDATDFPLVFKVSIFGPE